jgi:hypothetical protein
MLTNKHCPTTNPTSTYSFITPLWDEAFLRVESYLRAFGLESRVRLNQISSEIIKDARAHSLTEGASEPPVALAMRLTYERVGDWLARTGLELDWTNERTLAEGRLALILADLPGRWADFFLCHAPLPADLVASIASSQLLPSPELRLSNMPPAPLEFGRLESEDPGMQSIRTVSFSRAIVWWVFILGCFSVAWAASH